MAANNNRTKYFLGIFSKAEKKFGGSAKRLAGDSWSEPWQTLVATILSAQSRDEVTIPIAENLFERYKTLNALDDAKFNDVFTTIKSINYNKTKTKNIIAAAKFIVHNFNGKVPDNMEDLLKIPGVGRKTANLVLAAVHNQDSVCVDTHVHRLSNVLGFVRTKNPHQTELELMKIMPKKYWSRVNRIFVLWGKAAPGRDKKRLLKCLREI